MVPVEVSSLSTWRLLGDAEVAEENRVVATKQDVRRLDVSMDDALLVGVSERTGNLRHHVQRHVRIAPFSEPCLEVAPIHVLHGDVHQLARAADVVDGDDVGVAKRGDDLRLVLKPLQEVLVVGLRAVHHLENHFPAERVLDGEIGDGHAATPDRTLDFVPLNVHRADYRRVWRCFSGRAHEARSGTSAQLAARTSDEWTGLRSCGWAKSSRSSRFLQEIQPPIVVIGAAAQ